MCAITGLFSKNRSPIDENAFSAFTDSLAHRGPDGRGVYVSQKEGIALGHRRLSILDTSQAGGQPMLSKCGRYRIVFNGEVYNFLEIRNQLATQYSFETDTDTEVVLAAYSKWGAKAFYQFNGMWAIAIWDHREQELLLCRDRFGIKPLYFFSSKDRFLFASEVKAFLSQSEFHAEIDRATMAQTLVNPALLELSGKSILKNVVQLPAGCYLTISKNGSEKVTQWWKTYEHLQTPPKNYQDRLSHYTELFKSACQIRMRSDVPVATALSGGMDSSSIFCTLQKRESTSQLRSPSDWQHGFFAHYPNSVQDESKYVQEIEDSYPSKIHRITIKPTRLVETIDEVIFSFENLWDLPTGPYFLYQAYRKNGMVVSIDGHGGDELMAGYIHTIQKAYEQSLLFPPKLQQAKTLRDVLCGLTQEYPNVTIPSISATLRNHYLSPLLEKTKDLVKFLLRYKTKENGGFVSPKFWSQPTIPSTRALSLEPLNQALYTEFHHTTLPSILRNFDRLGMAHGVEIRAPFMDYRLVTYAMALPASDKLANGYTRWLHREAMKGIVPDSIRLRKPKTGFSSPLDEYILGPLQPFVLDHLNSRSFLESDIFDGPKVRSVMQKAISQKDSQLLKICWNFVQAHRLQQLFRPTATKQLAQTG